MFGKQKQYIMKKIKYFRSVKYVNQYKKGSKNRVYLIGTPSHGNLGDHAIAMAEVDYLKKVFPEYELNIISEEEFNEKILPISKCLTENDIIFLTGGGNLGDIYILDENIRRTTIKLCKKSKIYILPQTIYFTNTIYGNLQKTISKIIYSMNKNLVIYLREQQSYEIAKKIFKYNDLRLMPDMVLSQQMNNHEFRKGILMVLRSDRERSLTRDKEEKLKNSIYKLGRDMNKTVDITDTVVEGNLSLEEAIKKIKNKIDMYNKRELIITDRLHGMIFAVITGSNCIVLPNFNHKLESLYKTWLQGCKFIFFCKNIDEIERLSLEILSSCKMDNQIENFENYFNKMAEELKIEK